MEPQLHVPLEFTVPAIEPWYSTGIFLRKDCAYTFDVPDGQTWKDGEMLGDIPPDGINRWYLTGMLPFLRMPSVKWYALLGCIGKKRPYFKIGSHKEDYVPQENGELICFANDALLLGGYFYRHNNTGKLKVTIMRTR